MLRHKREKPKPKKNNIGNAMLSKILKKPLNNDRDSIFPKPERNNAEEYNLTEGLRTKPSNTTEVCLQLLNNKGFIEEIETSVTQNILTILLEKYDFVPTDKYLKQQEERKKYINQLDAYLEDRRKIKNNVETDLQAFLKNVNETLASQLNNFSQTISDRIAEAEQKHGIDKLKDILTEKAEVAEGDL